MSSSAASRALETLPHGEEFRFVDELTELEPGKRGAGVYRIPQSAPFLRGHFPGRPMMPGVLMVEALAQLGGVVLQSDPSQPVLADLRLTAMRQVKVFGTGLPGQELSLTAEVAGRLGPLVQVEGEVRCEDRVLVTARLTLSGDLPDPDPDMGGGGEKS